MKKTLSIVCGILLFSCQSYATTLPFQGAYIAAGIGGTFAKFDTNQLILDQNVPPNFFKFSQSQSPKMYASNVIGSFGVGFTQRIMHRYAIGIEGTADVGQSRSSHTTIARLGGITLRQSITAKLKNNFSLLFKPGIILNSSTFLYAIVGPRWGNFSTSATSNLTTASAIGTATTVANSSSYKTGITAGIGLEEALKHGLSFTMEYFYTSYGSVAKLNSSAPLPQVPNARLVQTGDLHVTTNSVLLSLLYRFS